MEYFIILILSIVAFFFGFKLYLVKKQLKNIGKQMEEEQERFVSMDLVDKDLEKVVVQINERIDSAQIERADARKEEQQLRTSISMISHDMRTPLTSVIGYLQLAKKNCKEEENLQNIEIALDRADYCNKLVNDFFELSVIDSDTYTPVMEKVNLCEVVCEEILANCVAFEKKGIMPIFEQADDTVWVLADKKLLVRVIQNLISNNIKYATGKVRYSISQDEKVLLEIVSDSAHEINAEKIFDKFYQGDSARGSEGTGLGLFICRRFMEDMDGRIWAESSDEEFRIKVELNLYFQGG